MVLQSDNALSEISALLYSAVHAQTPSTVSKVCKRCSTRRT
jgi:hypothetical protein